jgi:hypothetical protein
MIRCRPVPVGAHLWAEIAAWDAAPLRERHSHAEGAAIALTNTRWFMPDAIGPLDVIRVLSRANVPCVLVGAYALAGWLKEPRATKDVDVVVAARHHSRALRAIRTGYPALEMRDTPVVTRFIDAARGFAVIDVMKTNQPLTRSVLRHTRVVGGRRPYRIPTLEMALALKFAPMTSPFREDQKKYQDAADFIALVKFNPTIDLRKLMHLGELVYSGGGAEIIEMVRRVRAGERLEL